MNILFSREFILLLVESWRKDADRLCAVASLCHDTGGLKFRYHLSRFYGKKPTHISTVHSCASRNSLVGPVNVSLVAPTATDIHALRALMSLRI